VTGVLIEAEARKSLGQHFLFNDAVLRRIALAAGPLDGVPVLEIGPGPGGLTRAILEAGAGIVMAVEADARFANGLAQWPEAVSGRLRVVNADARKVDVPSLLAETGVSGPVRIIANLPYNVATPLLVGWLKAGGWRGEMVLMFQKEVALRICGEPSQEHYGRLSVISSAVCRSRIALTLPPGAFRPPPKVDSAVVVMSPLGPGEGFADLASLETVSAAAFGNRRKMLRAALKSLPLPAGGAEALLRSAGIDATRRAETLSQEEFRALARAYSRIASGQSPDEA